jgi:cytochrome P450 monooxygenase
MDESLFWPIIGLLAVVYLMQASAPALKGVPTVKFHRFLPNFINRILYYPKAASLIAKGYNQVCILEHCCK